MRGPSLAGSMPIWAKLAEALGRQTEQNEKARHKVIEHRFFAFMAVFMLHFASMQSLRLVVVWVLDPRNDCAVELLEGSEAFPRLKVGR